MFAFAFVVIASVEATPDAETVTVEAHAPELIALVPSEAVPLAIVCVPPAQRDPLLKQMEPLPETAAARAVATPVPNPLMPVLTGRPVAFVSVPEVGVPKIGVVIEQDVVRHMLPLPDVAIEEVTVLAVAATGI